MIRIRTSTTIHFLVTSFVMTTAAFVLTMSLVGCASEDAPTQCLRYGFTPHTDGFANCMLQLDARK